MSGIANTDQAEFWSGKAGEVWVREQAMFDAMLGPVLDMVLERAALQPGQRVVDIGCGTGASSVAAARAVGAAGHVLGLDVSGPMLELARERAKGLDTVELLLGDAQVQDLSTAQADLVISRFGVMFFADPVAAFANIKTALRPGGRMVFAAWDGPGQNPWFRVPAEVARELVGAPPKGDPRAPGPMAFADVGYVQEILSQAGFQGVEIETAPVTLTPLGDLAQNAEFASREGPTGRIIKEMGGGRTEFEAVAKRLKEVFAEYETADGAVRIPGMVHLVAASA